MKKHLLSLFALCLMSVGSAYAQSEIVVGDMNDDGTLSVTDVTLLTDAILSDKAPRVISTKCDPNASDPAAIAGYWSTTDNSKLILGVDGSATVSSNSAVTSFEYYPFRGDLVLLDAEGYCVQDFHVLRQTPDYLLFVLADGTYATYYSYENLSKQNGGTHEYVDLGLPSGTLWATCNIGAASPEDYGDYFAWGETQPKSTYNWSTYKWMKEGYSDYKGYNKYTAADGQTSCCWYNNGTFIGDNKTELDLNDDAAYMNWGEGWRMPSYEQQDELRTNCTWYWDSTKNGCNVVGPNNNSLFLPAAGGRDVGGLERAGSWGYYWSRSLSTDGSRFAYFMVFASSGMGWESGGRCNGLPVRPVRVSASE